ncbi:ABC transporter ATP-binding protein [Devosia ginsengisoli]|uniref:ABC transporter ATP-binding protein n=1 Tax=Devosia ginsengisoli TaxID=400770 RepID=A0A5B8LTT1_9HYPH|nr:ABC transporter ATP-binding protein [Devosia ginsengisoli]QDZ11623.1 ABC transporter ATP-binding protein [Devosia ginsengisoli]
MGLLKRILGSDLSPEGGAFIRREIADRRLPLAGFFLLSLVAASLEMMGLGLVFPLLLIVVDPANIDRVPMLGTFIDALGVGRGRTLSLLLIGLIGVIMVSKNAYMLFFNWLQMRTLARWKTDLSRRMMRLYLFSDYSVHLAKSTSEIIRNVSLSAAVYDQFVAGLLAVFANGLLMVGLVVVLTFVLPPETLVSLVIIGAAAYGLYSIMRGAFERIGRQENEIYQRRQSVLLQAIGMIKETKLRAKENFFLDAFVEIERFSFSRQARFNFLAIIPPLVVEGAIIVAILCIISYILFFSAHQNTGVAILGLLAATLFRLTPVINRLMSSLQLINRSRNSVDILGKEFSLLEQQVFQPDVEPEALSFNRDIAIENVEYTYPGGSKPAVRGMSLSIEKGEVIGITGTSGAGKSTLAALLMGLVPPQMGQILIDDHPLDTQSSIRAWQRHLGFVPQGVFLIEDTIAANIAFGETHETRDEARMWDALEVVQLRDFVESQPDRLNHFLGEQGSRLSGGQRQRIGIARVLYQDPDVLVFDEATSALDNAVERAFSDELMRLRRGRTLIIIAHRLTTLRDCDRIIMLDDGKVLDSAPFDELHERCAPFRRLVELTQLKLKEQGDAP